MQRDRAYRRDQRKRDREKRTPKLKQVKHIAAEPDPWLDILDELHDDDTQE